jgi:hypothetical protein
MGDGRWEMGDGRWEMGDGEEILNVEKRRRLVAVLDTSKARWPEGPKARAARLSQFWIFDFGFSQLATCNLQPRTTKGKRGWEAGHLRHGGMVFLRGLALGKTPPRC